MQCRANAFVTGDDSRDGPRSVNTTKIRGAIIAKIDHLCLPTTN